LGTDLLLAAVLAVVGQMEVWLLEGVRLRVVAALLYLAFSAALAYRRHSPLAVAVAVSVLANAAMVAGVPRNETFVIAAVLLIGVYSVAAHSERRAAAVGLAVALPLSWAGVLLTPGSKDPDNYAFLTLLLGGAWILGRMLRRRVLQAVALERRALQAEHDREDAMRAAVAEERGRIARELHDIIAHGLSLMIVQAGAAEQILSKNPAQAAAPLQTIQKIGREALGDMKRLLGLLRVEETADLAPQPSLAHVDRLVGQLTDAGLPVELRVEGDVRPLPAGVDSCGYRVLQEALTNSLKHGPPGVTTVVVRYGAHDLLLEITDDGTRAQSENPASHGLAGAGRGLVGMRERVGLYGGRLEAGGGPRGGYVVRARLPLEQT
jgi:signal transduction histidine kinase